MPDAAPATRKLSLAKSNGRNGTTRRRAKPPRMNSAWVSYEIPSVAQSGVVVTADTALTFPAAYRAICIIAGAIASMPLRVYRKETRYGREVSVPATEHPVDRLLRVRPSVEQSPMRWKEYNVGVMAVRGNAYNEIVWSNRGVPGSGAVPQAIYPLPPERMSVQRNEDDRELIEYVYQPDDGAKYAIPSDRILHFPLFGEALVGKSPVALFRESLGLGISTERHAASTIGKGMNPSGVLTHPGELNDEAYERLKNDMNRRHAGPENAGRVLILEDGMTWTQAAFNLRDSQFIEQRGFNVEDVSRIWGVPPHLLSQQTGAKYNNIEQLDLDFVKHTLLAYMLRIEEEIDFKLLGGDGEFFCKFNARALLRGDLSSRYNAYAIGRQWGWLSANDILALEDMDPLPPEVGDIYLSPVNMIPAEKAGMIGQPQPGESVPADEEPTKPEPEEPEREEAASRSALRIVFRDAVGRLLHVEFAGLEKLLKRATLDEPDIERFYERHVDAVRHALGAAWCAIGESDGRKADVDGACQRYAASAKAAVLGAWRHGERPELERLLAAWRKCRADVVTTEYMEACYANS